jgi:hypothetical protein
MRTTVLLAKDRAGRIMYSPRSMNGGKDEDIKLLEERLAELEKLAEDLEGVPDAEVVDVLEKAVALLSEVNARVEAGLAGAEGEAREIGELLQKVDFGPFDAALEDLEQRPAGDTGGV